VVNTCTNGISHIRYLTRCPVDGIVVSWPERLTMGKLGQKLPRFMPREASRVELMLGARLREPLSAVDDAGALAEGISLSNPVHDELNIDGSWRDGALRQRYLNLWDAINGPRGHSRETNPDVDVFRFRRVLADQPSLIAS
jgi:hypothetical protein